MNSVASVVRASSGMAKPTVKPLVWVSLADHVSKMMPVSGSVQTTGAMAWA